MWLFLLLVAMPIIEIALFIEVGGAIGLWPTLAIVVLTALSGTLLLRAQGVATMQEIQTRLANRADPTGPLAHGALILAAGLLLLTPGFFTDAVGLSLLFQPVRAAAIRFIARRVQIRTVGEPGPSRPARDTVIDGEYDVVDEDERRPPNPDSDWRRRP
ncbi:MAG: FxsA family protein [Pseudomonadota bacterium]